MEVRGGGGGTVSLFVGLMERYRPPLIYYFFKKNIVFFDKITNMPKVSRNCSLDPKLLKSYKMA